MIKNSDNILINKQKIIVIVGQTATGKSELGVRLAKKFNGEIISADSRQIYKGLDIGTGKITKKEMDGVPHHMLSIVNPRYTYTAWRYKKDAERAMQHIIQKGKIPFIVGGTNFYIDALLGNISLPNVPPNKKLRKNLEKKTIRELFLMLKKLDPKRAEIIDQYNKRRLIRAIEITKIKPLTIKQRPLEQQYNVLKIGIKIPDKELKKRITVRLFARIKKGMVAEAKRLHKQGLSWKRMAELGLEYRSLAQYLQGNISKKRMLKQIETASWQYARRQNTWLARLERQQEKQNKKIKWFTVNQFRKIEQEVKSFKNRNYF